MPCMSLAHARGRTIFFFFVTSCAIPTLASRESVVPYQAVQSASLTTNPALMTPFLELNLETPILHFLGHLAIHEGTLV